MRILRTMLKQTCVYWPPGPLTVEGQRTFGTPEEVKCRWEDCAEQFIDRMGVPAVSRAVVDVGADLDPLGVLWLPPDNRRVSAGVALSQLVDQVNPFNNPGAYEIRKLERVPTLKQRADDDALRTAWL